MDYLLISQNIENANNSIYIDNVDSNNRNSSDGNIRDKNVRDRNASDGHISDGHVSDGHISDGHGSDGHVSDGHISDGHVSDGDAIRDNQSESVVLDIDDSVILNTNKAIIYPNQKIYTVAPIIEQNIIDRDNYQPSNCLLRCQNCIRMMLDFATNIYIYLEYIIKIFTIILVHIDIFNITKSKLKIFGRSKFNKFVIEGANTEKLRRIVYWFYYNNITPDEDQWREVLTRFNLDEVPSFTMRLYNNNIKSIYTIELESMVLQTYQDNVVIKGSRTINLYEDIIDLAIEGDIFIKCGKKKIGTVSSKIPVGGLMPEKFISDLNLNKIVNNSNKLN